MFERDFLEMMPHVVGIEAFGGEDHHGDPLPYGPLTPFRARVVGKGLAVRKQFSEDATVIFDVYLDVSEDPNRLFLLEDRITLPPDLGLMDTTPVIFQIGKYPDLDGIHHVLIQCGWMYHRQTA